MKKIMFFAAVAAALSLASCQKDGLNEAVKNDPSAAPASESPVFTATIEAGSKTTIDAATGKVSWERNDVITITDASQKTARYMASSIDGSTGKATFTFVTGDELGDGPYTATYGIAPTTAQTYSATPGQLYMTASSETTSLTFTVQCGLMEINLTKAGESVKSIAVTGTPTGESETTYTLTCTDVQSIAEKKSFYLTLPAGSYNKIVILNNEGKFCSLTASTGISVIANHIKPVTFDASKLVFNPLDLSENESANCYVLYNAGEYMFSTVKGNSATAVSVTSAGVLWETVNTATAPDVGSIISDVRLENGYVHFKATGKAGNALIAAYNDSDIVWSWHIWVPATPIESAAYSTAIVASVMDRNLGALNAVPGDPLCNGFIYQWGRKDPFPGSVAYNSGNKVFAVSGTTPGREQMGTSTTVEYAVAHPTTFFYSPSSGVQSNQDWVYGGNTTNWGKDKTIYDPCPPGYSVGPKTVWGANQVSPIPFTVDKNKFGFTVDGIHWYPIGGTQYASDGTFHAANTFGYYWNCDTGTSQGNHVYLDLSTSKLTPFKTIARAQGLSVRCCSTKKLDK